MRRAAVVAAMLASGCGSKAPRPQVALMALQVCSMDTGAGYLPDPCRIEVAPGEWLRISSPAPEGRGDPAHAKRRPWWAVLLAALLI